jgi:ribulose-5-phosphate 4-epimerase/fuculose-1-phosphate aldolase
MVDINRSNPPTSICIDEWTARVDLAACYRLVALYGWSDLVATHISAKIHRPSDSDRHEYLINPYGLMFDEMTASSLVKIDLEGNKLGDSPHDVNRAGFVIHSAIHQARPEAGCVIHTHTKAGVAVSAQQCGLRPISQQASLVMGSLAYHDYEGLAVHDEEKARLQADLGQAKHMILRNHGLLTVGVSVADAFKAMYTLESACQIQVTAQCGGPLIDIRPEVLVGVAAAVNIIQDGTSLADRAWPSLLRRLDRLSPGYDC